MLNIDFAFIRKWLDRAPLEEIRNWRDDYHLAYYMLLTDYLDAGVDLAQDYSSSEAFDRVKEVKDDVYTVYHAYEMHHNEIVKRTHRGRVVPVKKIISLGFAKEYLEEILPTLWKEKMLQTDPEVYEIYDDLERRIGKVLERVKEL